MPPHLHPRSRTTSSLFATTVLASFVVVALPHLLPCPAQKPIAWADGGVEQVEYVDEHGQRRVRRRRRRSIGDPVKHPLSQPCQGVAEANKDGVVQQQHQQQFGFGEDDGTDERAAVRRECPVPKPSGAIGRWLGFKPKDDTGLQQQQQRVEVKVKERREEKDR